MKSGNLYLFKNSNEFNPLLGLSLTKERFRNAEFSQESWIMLAYQDFPLGRHDVLFDDIKADLISESTIKDFHFFYKNSIEAVKDTNETYKLCLSWFELLQLAAYAEFNKNLNREYILNASKNLSIFYNQSIKIYNF